MTKRDDKAYSPLKAVRHLDIVQAAREGRPARPAHVQIILSDLCNQACFPFNTPIWLPNGDLRAIQRVSTGDIVAGVDDGRIVESVVAGKMSRSFTGTLVRITTHKRNNLPPDDLLLTDDHLVWTIEGASGGWKKAGDVRAGNYLSSVRGHAPLLVTAVEHREVTDETVYNMETSTHNYFAGLSGVHVKNCNFCAYRDPSYTSSQMFFEIKPSGVGLRRDTEHPERNYNPNRMIPWKKIKEIVDDCAAMGVSGIQFTGGGEPTVHPDFIFSLALANSKGIATSLVTNGVNVGKRFDEWRKDLLYLKWIRFSLDAAREETYCRVRNVPSAHFQAALAAVRRLREARDVADGKGPVIGVGFVVTPDNWREAGAAALLARDLGADNIRISAQFSADDERLFDGFHAECAALCREAEKLNTDTFTVYNRFGEKTADLKQKAPDYDTCGYQMFTTYIGADLNVYRCCSTAYNEHGLVGSIKEQRFKDFWMTQERANDMLKFNARSCDRCQFNIINRNLEYLLSPEDPDHSAFV